MTDSTSANDNGPPQAENKSKNSLMERIETKSNRSQLAVDVT